MVFAVCVVFFCYEANKMHKENKLHRMLQHTAI
jgi:hypothetical protein